jgi:hypothetical protein
MMPDPMESADRAVAAIGVAFAAINELPHDAAVRSNTMTGGDIAAEAQTHLAAARRLIDIYREQP